MEYFIIEEGQMWNGILEILEEKAKEGLDVRLMYDDMGCILYFGNGIGYYHEGELGKNPPEFLMLNEVNDKN